jgi:hypothetical protein
VIDGAYGDSSHQSDPIKAPYETYVSAKNYRGRVAIMATKFKNAATSGSSSWDPNKTRFKVVCEGTAPVNVLLAANTFEQGAGQAVPSIEGGSSVGRHILANWNPGATVSTNKVVPNVTNGESLTIAGLALNDLRELSRMDLLLNHYIDSALFPLPTSEQATTPPLLLVLNWTKRSDWLDVKNLPSSVNGGVSAIANGNPANKARDTAAFLAACNEVRKPNSPWSTVYAPPGTYCIAEELFPYPVPMTLRASFTGSISGDVLTVTAVSSGSIAAGMTIQGNGVTEGPLVNQILTGTGGVGTYRLNISQTVSSRAMQAGTPRAAHMNIRGHGRTTVFEWHGAAGGRMFRSDSVSNSSFIGIVWDGRNIAAQGFMHRSTARQESKALHQFEVFKNFTGIGSGTVERPGSLSARYLESSQWRNCMFINCGTGLSATNSNDFMFNVDGCWFYDNNVGVLTGTGQALIRNTRFFRSAELDVKETNNSRANSIRRCSSVGSGAFYLRDATTTSVSSSRNTVLQDCYVSGWTNTSYAILSKANGANCWDPMLIFDCVFVNGPSANAPIRLDRAAQVLHSNNSWVRNGSTNTGAAVFAGSTANLVSVPVPD